MKSHKSSHREPTFESELESLLNRYSKDARTNTPDCVLANYISACLTAYADAVDKRDRWNRD